MKTRLDECTSLLTKAKELVCLETPNVELAMSMIEKSLEIIQEFDKEPLEVKKEYKEELLEIQGLTKVVLVKLEKEKSRLKSKIVHTAKVSGAIKGYSRN